MFDIDGWYISAVIAVRSSRSHTPIPSAEPAAIAAPSADISGMDGHTATQLHVTTTQQVNICCLMCGEHGGG